MDAAGVTAPPIRAFAAHVWQIAPAQVINAAFGLGLSLCAAAMVSADEGVQGWIPEVLAMPEDAEVVVDRAIGSTVRMYSIMTGADIDVLFSEWEESLGNNGYPVTEDTEQVLDRAIEFSGPGIVNAKIIAAPASEDGRRIIEFDATLD